MLAEKTRRILLADEWRGLAILLMVVYHALFDLVALFGMNIPFLYSPGGAAMQLFICASFITISGICCQFSHNNLRRGLVVFGLGMVLTVVTLAVMPSERILFGVLHLLGMSMVLFSLLRPLLAQIPTDWGVPLFVGIFLLLLRVPQGWLGLGSLSLRLPVQLYETRWLFWLGLPYPGFFSGDYFPLIPWLFLFLAGSFLGRYAQEGRAPAFVYRSHAPWLAAVGRYSIWIYMLHQPLTYGLLWLFFALRG